MVLSGGGEDAAMLGRDFGEAVGMTFQIIDDTLDFVGETEVMGKPRLADFSSERFTLPVIHAFKEVPREDVDRVFSDGDGSSEWVEEQVRANGGIEFSYEKAREYTSRAQSILSRFGNEKAISIFEDFFDMLVSRAY